jgi:DnaK suppressor protein
MNEALTCKYRGALHGKLAELIARSSRVDDLDAIIEADIFDEMQRAADRAALLESREQDSTTLREIRRALERIADGAYGECQECDRPIATSRLDAIPWARFCVKCQERAELEWGFQRGPSRASAAA